MENKLRKSGFINIPFLVFHLGLMAMYSCFVDPSIDNQDCDIPVKSNISALKQVFFGPYRNQQYADSSDTVSFADFRFNMEFEFEAFSHAGREELQGIAFDCAPKYNVQNISNIQVFLTAFFNDLPPGRDVSYLFLLPDGTQLSRFRDYSKMEQFLSLKLNFNSANKQQLNSLVIIYLKNGEQLLMRSTSPYLAN
jgi:hypothetical protein